MRIVAVALICCASAAGQNSLDPHDLWAVLKVSLTAPDADKYFDQVLKDTAFPMLRGTVRDVSADGTLNVVMQGDPDPEVTLTLRGRAAALDPTLQAGAPIEFSGVTQAFRKSPFHITLDVLEAQLTEPALTGLASSWYFGLDSDSIRARQYRGYGVQIDLPAGWSFRGTRRRKPAGDLVVLQFNGLENASAAVLIVPREPAVVDIHERLQQLMRETISGRSDLAHYAVREASVLPTSIRGQQALRAVGDYDNQRMSETFTWIVTAQTSVSFFGHTTSDRIQDLESALVPLIHSTVIP